MHQSPFPEHISSLTGRAELPLSDRWVPRVCLKICVQRNLDRFETHFVKRAEMASSPDDDGGEENGGEEEGGDDAEGENESK